jgi:hypothetical protein
MTNKHTRRFYSQLDRCPFDRQRLFKRIAGEIRRAVEKLFRSKFAKIKLRQDALQTAFLIFWTFCIPQILAVSEANRVFKQPRRVSDTDHKTLAAWSVPNL